MRRNLWTTLTFLLLMALALGCPEPSDDDDADKNAADDDTGDDDACADPVADPAQSMVGQTYFLDLGTAEFVEPTEVGGVLSQYIADVYVMMLVQAVDEQAGTLDVLLGSPPTEPFSGQWDNPYFEIGPADFPMEVDGDSYGWNQTELSGCFSTDGSSIQEMTLSGTMDTRALDDLIDPDADAGAACELLDSLGIECQPCPDDNEPYCLSVDANSFHAERVEPG